MARDKFTLPRLRPRAPPAMREFAGEVDSVFIQLEQILRDFKAAEAGRADTSALSDDTEEVNGLPAAQITPNRMVSRFIESFEVGVEDYWTQRDGDTSNITYPDNGTTGGNAFRATGHKRFEFPENIAYDPVMMYRIRGRARPITHDPDAGENQFRFGVQGVAADGQTIVDRTGGTDPSKPHVVGADEDMSAYTEDGDWVEFEAYFTQTSANGSASPGTMGDPATLQNDVTYVRPYFEVNADGGSGTMEVDYLAVDILTVDDEIDSLLTRNGPIEPDAEQTAGKDFSLLVSRFFANLLRSSTDNTALDIVVSKVDNQGDLTEQILLDDGAEKRVIVKGSQEHSAADGDSVSFAPVFQDTPQVLPLPSGVSWKQEFASPVRDQPSSGEVTLSAPAADDRYRIPWSATFQVTDPSGISGFWFEVDVELQYDDGTGYSTVDSRHFFQQANASHFQSMNDPTMNYEGVFEVADASVAGGDKYRVQVTANADYSSFDYSISGGIDHVEYVGAKEIFLKIVADSLTASGFTAIAKMVERNITTTAEVDSFPAGTLTAEGDALALGGLSADAWDDRYQGVFDLDLTVEAPSGGTQSHDDSFPSGKINAVGESKDVSVQTPNNGSFDVDYDWLVEATAGGGDDSFAGAVLDSLGETDSLTLSEDPASGDYTAHWSRTVTASISSTGSIETASADLSLALEYSTDGGSSWATHSTHDYSASVSGSSDASDSDSGIDSDVISSSLIGKGDLVRLRVDGRSTSSSTGGTATAEAIGDNVTYDSSGTSAIEVAVKSHDGSTWQTHDQTTYSVVDDTGGGASDSGTAVKSFSRSGVQTVRVEVTSITETGVSSATHEADPISCEYTTGSTEQSTITVKVALDSKDGANAWVERATEQFSHTDFSSSPGATTKSLTDEILSFVSSNIQGGDDVRLRLKTVTVDGNAVSSSVSLDPVEVRYNSFAGSLTEHTMTPITGDELDWVAMAV